MIVGLILLPVIFMQALGRGVLMSMIISVAATVVAVLLASAVAIDKFSNRKFLERGLRLISVFILLMLGLIACYLG